MKKAFQISLANTLFTMEEDAYTKLDLYLAAIKNKFASTEGKEEIIRDIEARIAEQFLETKKSIIAIEDVNAVIASMGQVEDIAAEEGQSPADEPSKSKKLYRNPDDTIIAGVCSGFAAYLGIDALWVRLAFVFFTFVFNGFTILVYIVLWIVLPEAKTASQKLEMNGSPVNIGTLSENAREKINTAGDKYASKIKKILSFPFLALKKIFEFIKKVLFPVARTLFAVVLGAVGLAAVFGASFMAPMALRSPEWLSDVPLAALMPNANLYTMIASGYLLVAIPAICLFLLAISILRKKSFIKPGFGLGLLTAWILALAGTGASAAIATDSYQKYIETSPAHQVVTRELSLPGSFDSLNIAHGQDVKLVQDDTRSLVASGRDKDIERLELEVREGTLYISNEYGGGPCIFCSRRTPEITLTLPFLESIVAAHGSEIEAAAWTSLEPMSVRAAHGSDAELVIKAPSITAYAEHGSHIELGGSSDALELEARHGSHIDADSHMTKDAAAGAFHGSSIIVQVTETLKANAEHGSEVLYSGSPKVDKNEEFGGDVRSIDIEEIEIPEIQESQTI